jgi:hypothetical protein
METIAINGIDHCKTTCKNYCPCLSSDCIADSIIFENIEILSSRLVRQPDFNKVMIQKSQDPDTIWGEVELKAYLSCKCKCK